MAAVLAHRHILNSRQNKTITQLVWYCGLTASQRLYRQVRPFLQCQDSCRVESVNLTRHEAWICIRTRGSCGCHGHAREVILSSLQCTPTNRNYRPQIQTCNQVHSLRWPCSRFLIIGDTMGSSNIQKGYQKHIEENATYLNP